MKTCPTLDSFSAFADIVQPASVKGNSLLDTISGVIRDITPAATNVIGGVNTKLFQQQAMMPINQPTSSVNYMPLLIAGGVGLIALVFLARRK